MTSNRQYHAPHAGWVFRKPAKIKIGIIWSKYTGSVRLPYLEIAFSDEGIALSQNIANKEKNKLPQILKKPYTMEQSIKDLFSIIRNNGDQYPVVATSTKVAVAKNKPKHADIR